MEALAAIGSNCTGDFLCSSLLIQLFLSLDYQQAYGYSFCHIFIVGFQRKEKNVNSAFDH